MTWGGGGVRVTSVQALIHKRSRCTLMCCQLYRVRTILALVIFLGKSFRCFPQKIDGRNLNVVQDISFSLECTYAKLKRSSLKLCQINFKISSTKQN